MSEPVENIDAKKSNFSGEDNDDIIESDIELDNTNIVEPDNDPPQKVGLDRVNVNLLIPVVFLFWFGPNALGRVPN